MGRFTTFILEVERLRTEVERIHASHRRSVAEHPQPTRVARGSARTLSPPTTHDATTLRTPAPCETDLAQIVHGLESSLSMIWRLGGHLEDMTSTETREVVTKIQHHVATLDHMLCELVKSVTAAPVAPGR